MARFAFLVLLLAALQAGCSAMPERRNALRSSPEPLRPTCDTSVGYIDMVATIQNTSNAEISFHLDDDRGPPYDLWYLGYIVHSSMPGERFNVVHYSGHDSEWDRTLTIAPGDSAVFTIPVFGLRPADYLRYFRVELRDSKRRSYWTPVFELCAFVQASCRCPPVVGSVASPQAQQACPVMPVGGAAGVGLQGEIGVACR